MEACAGVALPSWVGARVASRDGVPVGRVSDLLFDVHSHAPGWLAVERGDGCVLVPARRLHHHAAGVEVRFSAELVFTAPVAAGPPGELGPLEGAELAKHFGVRCGGGPWRGLVEVVPSRPVPAPRLRRRAA